MAVADTKRKLTISPTFVPYLEKHRIYELFYEIGCLLAIDKPDDHILYLKNLFYNLKTKRDRPRVVLITPPHIDANNLANEISEQLNTESISITFVTHNEPEIDGDPGRVVAKLRDVISKEYCVRKGWILYDFPRTRIEARLMLKHGLIPTHTLQILPSHYIQSKCDIWHSALDRWSPSKLELAVSRYLKRAREIRDVFKSSLKDIYVRGRDLKEITKICTLCISRCPFPRAPMLYRLVLIGGRGSYRRTIAQMLSCRHDLIHVDMLDLIEAGRVMDNEIGEQIRRLDKHCVPLFADIIITLLKNRLMKKDCLRKGWVLTSFPRDRADLEVLDKLPTPPNRVIFLLADGKKCLKRLKKRRVNVHSGEVANLQDIVETDRGKYARHPDDRVDRVKSELEYFSENLKDMMDYCGDNCFTAAVTGSLTELYERVEGLLVGPSPAAPPRLPPPQVDVAARFSGVLLNTVSPVLHIHRKTSVHSMYLPPGVLDQYRADDSRLARPTVGSDSSLF